MRRFSELLCSFAIWAVLSWCDGCITSAGDDLHSVNITNISEHFDFRYKNASNLSDSSLWAIISWNIEGGEKLDGILYHFTNSETDASWSRKKRTTILPPYPILGQIPGPGPIPGLLPGPGPGPGTSICDGVNDTIWAVNENGTSVQCQVPCKGILANPCTMHGVCHYLKEDYKTIPREERTVELPALFGQPHDLNLRAYKDWKAVEIAKIKIDSFFCRNELIMNYGISEDVTEDFCARVQIIDKNTHTSGPVTDLKIAHTYRDMAVNRGVVIVEWQEPFDVFPSVNIVQYSVYASKGDPDKGTVDVSDKDGNDSYRIKVENIKFKVNLTVQIIPVTNISDCADCTEHGKWTTIKYRFSDINACLGDNFTAQYCDNIASCVDLPLENSSPAVCTCPAGYTGNAISTNFTHGTGCVDLDSCAPGGTGNGTCDPNAICLDLPPPSYEVNCTCPGNYIGDGYRSGSGCREESLIIGLAVGIPLVIITVLLAVYIVLKFRLQRKRKLEEKMSHFLTSPNVEYTPSVFTIANGHESEGLLGPKWELDRNAIELKGILGRGNFGVVHEALLKSEDDQKLVAVKMTSENPPESLKIAFLSEISTIIQCGDHENLIGIIGCCTTGDLPIYLVSEYMKYGDLLHFLWNAREERNRKIDPIYDLTEYNIYHISTQVACGLRYLADMKIIHGDIAARNVLVGEGLKCKISDFGLANDVYRYGMIKGATEKHVPLKWVSPERMMGGKVPITWRSDVWSFGILLYETITLGSAPYPDVDTDQIFETLKSGYRMSKPGYCSQYLYDIMLKCWQWSPSKRPSFKKLEEDLKPPSSNSNETYVNLITVVPSLERENEYEQPTPNETTQGNIHANGTSSEMV